ncbi:MAG: hypothetical protein A2Z88_07085 [Omnitrophica WOR_2 bacterium GWA2_47_8]|nr:MAG: hypothetical protein A2Z88_07085 [Omnitrophica WOR_2 bacterium GWA2_47_8]
MKRNFLLLIFIVTLTLCSGNISRAQELVCCGHLVSVHGDWFGADRRCAGYLQDHPEKREMACKWFLEHNNVCEELKPYCKLCSGTDGEDTYPPDDPVVQSIIAGFHAQGIMIGPEYILVQSRHNGTVDRFVVRLDANGCVLPDGQCVIEAGESGYLPEGKQEGAFRHLYGSVVTLGKRTRVMTRIVNIETGVIMANGKGDGGVGASGMSEATANAVGNMGMTCKDVRGLILD